MTKTITGTWQFPDGSAVANGTLYLQLTQDANVVSTGQIAPRIVQIALDATGSIPAATVVFANDELTPSGTLYQVAVTQQGGGRVYGPELYSITGVSPISLNSFVPLTSGVFVSVGPKFQQFTANGTFTIPNGVTSIKATVIGGGGAGGGSTNVNNGGGGGAAAAAIKWLSGLTPGNTLAVTVGASGTGVNGASGNSGTASSISSGTQIIATVTANGGGGGSATGAISGGGAGGTASGGDQNLTGSAGDPGASSVGGAGGASILGGCGTGASGTNPGGAAGSFGSGGGGAGAAGANQTGGAASPGIVTFEWVG